MKNSPKISVIVPFYNSANTIERCVQSIFAQKVDVMDIIFVDDHGNDGSFEKLTDILKKYPDRKDQVRIIRHERNRGSAAARQTGIENAIGEYTIQIDSDDYIDENMFSSMLDHVKANQSDIVICDFNYIYPTGTRHIHVNPKTNNIECLCQILKGEVHASLCNKLIRLSLYRDNNICFIEGVNMLEDLCVMCQLLYFARNISYIPQPFYNYIIETDSLSNNISKNNIENRLHVYKEVDSFFCCNKIDAPKCIDAKKMFLINVLSLAALNGIKYDLDLNFSEYKYLLPEIDSCRSIPKINKIALKCRIHNANFIIHVISYVRSFYHLIKQ